MSERSRIVSHGKSLRSTPDRTNAQRLSPARPCQDTSTLGSACPAIDLTGYRHRPTALPTALTLSQCHAVLGRRGVTIAAAFVSAGALAASAQAASLYTGPAPRPGPDILYSQAASAPQLQNGGI